MYFHKKQDPQQAVPCASHAATLALNNPKLYARSLLEASVKITGDLWSEGDVQIEGHLCGNINCAQLIVGKDAAVTGVIIAQEAVIRGKITGIIRARRVLLQDTAQVESEIIYRTLSVDEGARFEGLARPRLDPLQEEIAVSPMVELRQRLAPVEVAANGAGLAKAQAVSKAAAVSSPEPQFSVERSSAGGG